MRKIIFGILIITCLSSCATLNYNAQLPKEANPTNPYMQKPMPDDGLAGLLKNIISR